MNTAWNRWCRNLPSSTALSLYENRITPIIITDITGKRNVRKVGRGNLERGVTWNAALSSAYYSGTKTVRLPLSDGIRRYTSALSYHELQVSDSSFVGSFAGILYSLCNQISQINLSDDSKLLTVVPCTSNCHL